MAKPCSHNELTARVVAIEAGLIAFKQLMDERDRRYALRATSQDATLAVATTNSEKAINKAEQATEKRLEGLNEIREMALDQAKTFAPENEVKLLITGLETKIEAVKTIVNSQVGRTGGIKEAWGTFAVAAGLIIAALAIYFRH